MMKRQWLPALGWKHTTWLASATTCAVLAGGGGGSGGPQVTPNTAAPDTGPTSPSEPRSTLTDTPAVASKRTIVPNIGRIVFDSSRDGNREIYIMNSDASGKRA